MENTVAIIKARMGSKRLPGKMLKKLSKFSLVDKFTQSVYCNFDSY